MAIARCAARVCTQLRAGHMSVSVEDSLQRRGCKYLALRSLIRDFRCGMRVQTVLSGFVY